MCNHLWKKFSLFQINLSELGLLRYYYFGVPAWSFFMRDAVVLSEIGLILDMFVSTSYLCSAC